MIGLLLAALGSAGVGCEAPDFSCPYKYTCTCDPGGRSWTEVKEETRRRRYLGPDDRVWLTVVEPSVGTTGSWIRFQGFNDQGQSICGLSALDGLLDTETSVEFLPDGFVAHTAHYDRDTSETRGRREVEYDRAWLETSDRSYSPTHRSGQTPYRECTHPTPCARVDQPCRAQCTDPAAASRAKAPPPIAAPQSPARCDAPEACVVRQNGRSATWTEANGTVTSVLGPDDQEVLRFRDREPDGIPDDVTIRLRDRGGAPMCEARLRDHRLVFASWTEVDGATRVVHARTFDANPPDDRPTPVRDPPAPTPTSPNKRQE